MYNNLLQTVSKHIVCQLLYDIVTGKVNVNCTCSVPNLHKIIKHAALF